MIEFAFQEGQLHEKHNYFLFSTLAYSGALNLGKIYADFSGEIVTPSSVLDHREVAALPSRDLRTVQEMFLRL